MRNRYRYIHMRFCLLPAGTQPVWRVRNIPRQRPSLPRFTIVTLLAALALQLAGTGCAKKTKPIPAGPVTTQEINQWILDSLQYFYYWNQQLPAEAPTDEAPTDFFAAVKNTADRFSLLVDPTNPATFPANLRNQFGLEVSIINQPTSTDDVIGVINLVLPGSPAALAGFQRGQFFSRINNTPITPTNTVELLQQLALNKAGQLTLATMKANGSFTDGQALNLQNGMVTEPSILQASTQEVAGRKIAYLCYNYFNDLQSNELISQFRTFKQQGVARMILDLRYSPGGSVASAALLCALAGRNIQGESVFVRYVGNNRLGSRAISFNKALSLPEGGTPVLFSQITDAQLNLESIYILTSSATASAAELIINNLKPYMQVVQIGDTTLGKDEGVIIIQDLRQPKRINWVLLPVSSKLENAQGNGGYSTGIRPDFLVEELSELPLEETGSLQDPLISKAFQLIQNGGRSGAQVAQAPVVQYPCLPATAYPLKINRLLLP